MPLHSTHRLRRQADLRHQDDGTPATLEPPPDGFEVHEGLPASRDPEEECPLPCLQPLHACERAALIIRQGIRRRGADLPGKGIAHPLDVLDPRLAPGDQRPDECAAESELRPQMGDRNGATEFFDRFVERALTMPATKELLPLEEGGSLLRNHQHPLGYRAATGVGRDDPERHGAHPRQAVDRVPDAAPHAARNRRHRCGAPLPLQPVEDLPAGAARRPASRRDLDDDLGAAPEARGECRLQRQSKGRAVVACHPLHRAEQGRGERRFVVGGGKDGAGRHLRRRGLDGGNNADEFPAPHGHDDPRPGRHAVSQCVRDLVGVGGGERKRERDLRVPWRHRGVTPSPGPVGMRSCPPEMVAPTNGSFERSAAPSRSTMSTSGVKCAAAVMASELSIMQPTITIM